MNLCVPCETGNFLTRKVIFSFSRRTLLLRISSLLIYGLYTPPFILQVLDKLTQQILDIVVCPYLAVLLIRFIICSISKFSCLWAPLGFWCYFNSLHHYAHTFFKMSFMSRKYLRPRCDNIRRAMRHVMEAPEDQRVSTIGHSTT